MELFPPWIKILFVVVFVLFNICFLIVMFIGKGENRYIRIKFLNRLKAAMKYLVFLFFMFTLGILVNYLIN